MLTGTTQINYEALNNTVKSRVFGVPLQDRVHCVKDQLQSSDVEGEAVTEAT